MTEQAGRTHRRRPRWPYILAGSVTLALAVTIILALVLFRSFRKWWEGPTADFPLPPSVEVVERFRGPSDFLGDHSYGVCFRLSEEDLVGLRRQRLWWQYFRKQSQTTTAPADWGAPQADWQEGPLPDDALPGGVSLKDHPQVGATYVYLHRRVEGGWWRALIIDTERRLVWYYRVTW